MKGINPQDEIKGSISTPKGKHATNSSGALLEAVPKFVSDCLKKVLTVCSRLEELSQLRIV